MYEKLVKQLQYCATHDCTNEGEVEVGCTAPYEGREGTTTCNDVLMLKAADAIEELSRVAEVNAKRAMFWAAQAEKYNWISVTERLPEDRSDVLAYLKYEVGGRIAAANYDKGMWQDCVMGGLYRTEEGVFTHWMPLPEPPKEEKK